MSLLHVNDNSLLVLCPYQLYVISCKFHNGVATQYCSSKYVKLLQDYEVQISMTQNGDTLENAIAERVNGILKQEYLECYQVENINEAKVLLEQVIKLYNQDRPHMSIGNLVPEKVHNRSLEKGEIKWKNYYQKKILSINFRFIFEQQTYQRI